MSAWSIEHPSEYARSQRRAKGVEKIIAKFGGQPPSDCRKCPFFVGCNPNSDTELACELSDREANVDFYFIPPWDEWLNKTHEDLPPTPPDPLGGQNGEKRCGSN